MLSLEQKAIEYRAAHWYPVPARPDGTHTPSCDLAPLLELMYNPTDMAHGEGLVSIVSKKCDGRMVTISTLPTSRLSEFVADSFFVVDNWNYYITKGSFCTGKNRCADNVYGYDYIAVEVDCHNSAMSAGEIKSRAGAIVDVLRAGPVADDILPDPNIAIYSGRGIHLIWCINRVSAPCANSIKVTTNAYADVIEQELRYFPCFADFTVDRGYCNNPSGLIRLPGTINTANGAVASYEIYHTSRISIPAGKEAHENRCVVAAAQHDISSTTRTGIARMRAIESLVGLRGNLCTGARDIITLIYYCSAVMAGYSAETCESLALMLNASFSVPRPESEVINSLSSAREKRYKYTDDKIISLLDIGNAELAAIGWHAITGKHAKRDAQRARAREIKIAEVLQLYEEGQSISAIGRITGHSRNSVRKWIASFAVAEESLATDAVSEDARPTNDKDTPTKTATTSDYHPSADPGQKWAQYNDMLISLAAAAGAVHPAAHIDSIIPMETGPP